MIRDEQPAPIILTRPQVLALATRGEIEIRLSARARGPAALPDCTMDALLRRYAVGRRLWARESFATRRDGAQLKILYPWQGPGPQRRFIPIDRVERKYLTERYVTRPPKYMPRWAARILLEVTAAHPDPAAAAVVITARLHSAVEKPNCFMDHREVERESIDHA